MAPNLDRAPGWMGGVSGCRAGRPSAAAQRATLESLNFVRALGGLDPVRSPRISPPEQLGPIGDDFARARVSVTRNGTPLDVTVYRPVVGYGQPTVVFGVEDVQPTGAYRVRVTRIRGAGPASHAYTVRIFEP